MDLLLWRHAEAFEAEEGQDDLARGLTPRGKRQAKSMAAWLDRHLPERTRVWVSPAQRAVQTAQALERRFHLADELVPGATAQALLQRAQWPHARQPVLLVGHQPTLGQTIAQLLEMPVNHCSVRKGGLWWLRAREREGQWTVTVLAVQSADRV